MKRALLTTLVVILMSMPLVAADDITPPILVKLEIPKTVTVGSSFDIFIVGLDDVGMYYISLTELGKDEKIEYCGPEWGEICGKNWTVTAPSTPGYYDYNMTLMDTSFNAAYVVRGVNVEGAPPTSTEINIDPDTLNLRSRGKWITAYIEIPGDETAYAHVYFECGEVGGCTFMTMFDIEVGESKKPGCGTLTLLEARENYTRFEMSILEWKWEFTLSKGGSKKMEWDNHWVTVKLLDVFPGSGGSMDIDVNTVKLEYNGKTVNAENNLKYGFVRNPKLHDTDNDGIPEFMVKFDREEVKKIVDPGLVTLKVSGKVNDSYFEGSDTIRVIGKTVSKIFRIKSISYFQQS